MPKNQKRGGLGICESGTNPQGGKGPGTEGSGVCKEEKESKEVVSNRTTSLNERGSGNRKKQKTKNW